MKSGTITIFIETIWSRGARTRHAPKKGYKRKFPTAHTTDRIRALATYREQYMKEKGKVPVWTAACNFMGVHMSTVLRHAPELAKNWYDKEFHS